MSGARDLGASAAAAFATGIIVFGIWPILGLPDRGGPLDAPFPGAWRWVFAVALPALFPAYTAVHVWLARVAPPEGAATVAAASRWNRWSHAALPGFVAWMVAWRAMGGWRLALGAFLVTLLFAKTLCLALVLFRVAFGRSEPEDDARALPGAAAFLGATALPLYAGLAPYVATAVSTAGDEPLYLLSTHSLVADWDR